MKKIVTILLLTSSIQLFAKDTCVSVQLLSAKTKPEYFSLDQYPQDCKDMYIGNTFTLRCGCFATKKEGIKRLKTLQKSYPQAILTNTYKYRFQQEDQQAQETQSTRPLSAAIAIPDTNTTTTTQTTPIKTKQTFSKKSCYSLEIVHKSKTRKNLEELFSHSYPQECKVMAFRYSLGVRCGCKPTKDELNDLYKKLKKQYKKITLRSTYMYRFDPTYKATLDEKTNNQYYNDQNITKEDDDLRLLLQVFLFKGDVNTAYRVATLGARKYPNSVYWNQKAMEIAQWSNHPKESIKYMTRLYHLTNSPDFEEKLISYGVESYRYKEILPIVLNKLHKNFTRENFDLVVFVYKKIGEPEKIVSLALDEYKKDPSRRFLLALALRTSLEMGDLEKAQEVVDLIQHHKPYTKEEANLLARYYYIMRDIPQSYQALEDANASEKTTPAIEKKFNILKSDLGWYLQKQIPAANASLKLIKANQDRIEDYERVFNAYEFKNPDLALSTIKEGYKKYKKKYLFYTYTNDAVNFGRYDDLESMLELVKDDPKFEDDPIYWILKGKLYSHQGKKDLAAKALKKALKLSPDNVNIKIALLWNFMENNDVIELKSMLRKLENEYGEVEPALYFPLASSYFYLHNINEAGYYLDKVAQAEPEEANKINFLFFQAYLFKEQNRQNGFLQNMRKVKAIMEEQAKRNPALWQNADFLSNYFRAISELDQNDEFYAKLQKYKKYLRPKDYEEIYYSYASKIDAKDLAKQIFYNSTYKPLWLRYSHALATYNHTEIENFLTQYLEVLSAGETIKAAENDGQIALAQYLNFKYLDMNRYNQNMYIQQIDLSKQRSDLFEIKPAYYHRKPLLQKFVKIKNRTYLDDGYYLHVGVDYFHNKSIDDTILDNLENTTSIYAEIEKQFQKGKISFLTGYNDKFDTYYTFILDGNYRLTDATTVGLKLSKGENADESTQLYLAGHKDSINPYFSYKFTPSLYTNIAMSFNKYYANDGTYLGKGRFSRIDLTKIIRNGYPDLYISGFYHYATYDEKDGKKGVIDTIDLKNFAVLPNEFYNVGINFGYGLANSDIYTRVWRPFFQGAFYYSSDIDTYSYDFLCGYGGKVWNQDHLVIGLAYIDSVNGISGRIVQLYLDYKFLYHMPR